MPRQNCHFARIPLALVFVCVATSNNIASGCSFAFLSAVVLVNDMSFIHFAASSVEKEHRIQQVSFIRIWIFCFVHMNGWQITQRMIDNAFMCVQLVLVQLTT